ncbi:MAG: hypothetical protein QGI78_02330 [Phycisphaerales bacterium]|jgi:hypothetical protein|nr:hypothetical protein [Phycisphaerales bacterium]
MKRTIFLLALIASSSLAGCAVFGFGGAVKQSFEDQKLVEKHPAYSLNDTTAAIVITADLSMHYEHPGVANLIAEGVVARLAKAASEGTNGVQNVKILAPSVVAQWQFNTPQWSAMATSELIETLDVDRVIYIDLHEYRLTPPGNEWLWEGVCEASVGIIEKGAYEQDGFTDVFSIQASFPRRPSVLAKQEADEADIARGLLTEFMKQTAWLFYTHLEPKNPDRYRPELDS